MFGLSFWEIVVVGIVAFLVFGPEQFPGMVKKIFRYIRLAKDFVSNVQYDFMESARNLESEMSNSMVGEEKNRREGEVEEAYYDEGEETKENLKPPKIEDHADSEGEKPKGED